MEQEMNNSCHDGNKTSQNCELKMTENVLLPDRTNETGKDEKSDNIKDSAKKNRLLYGVEDIPPIGVIVFYACQLCSNLIPGPVTTTYIVSSTLCAGENKVLLAQLLSTSIFASGLATFVQATLGVRLPIIQGSGSMFVLPQLAMVSSGEWTCDTNSDVINNTTAILNGTSLSDDVTESVWQTRVLQISGALVLASLLQTGLGLLGLAGAMMTYIGPITIGTTIILVSLALVDPIVRACQHQWGIALMTTSLIVIFSMFLGKYKIPCLGYRRGKGCTTTKYPIFKLYAIILALATGWILCFILTVAGVFTDDPNEIGYKARTDAKIETLHQSTWFYFPYPGQFGAPQFHPGLFTGMLAACAVSVIDSIGDYYACARMCKILPPPKHAINRGLAVEGVSSILSGFYGAAHATTSYTDTIGTIAITQMGSRIVYQTAGIAVMVLAVIGKVGGILAMVPDPVIGGGMLAGVGMLVSVSVTNLVLADINSPRNQMAFGMAFVVGAVIPRYIALNPGVIQTGSSTADQVLTVFLGTGMLVGGTMACLMDNLLPGTREERGFIAMQQEMGDKDITTDEETNNEKHISSKNSVYDLPFGMAFLSRYNFFTYIPCLPQYKTRTCKPTCSHVDQVEIETPVEETFKKI